MSESKNAKVIVADDEQVIANSLGLILSMSGFDARAAYSGLMAIEMARNFQPDILVTDVVMPGMTGIEAASRMRELLPSCRVRSFQERQRLRVC